MKALIPLAPFFRIGFGVDRKVSATGPLVMKILVPVRRYLSPWRMPGTQAHGIRTRIGFGERHGADFLATHQRRQIFFFERLTGVFENIVGTEVECAP